MKNTSASILNPKLNTITTTDFKDLFSVAPHVLALILVFFSFFLFDIIIKSINIYNTMMKNTIVAYTTSI